MSDAVTDMYSRGRKNPCRPSGHSFAMNGRCHHCRWTRKALIAFARETLEVLG